MRIDPSMLERVQRSDGYAAPEVERVDLHVPLYNQLPLWIRACKRVTDVAVAAVGLVGFGLAFPLVALAIKLDSPGPVFYRQVRVGINRRRVERRAAVRAVIEERRNLERPDRRKILQEGESFVIYKLRTMYENSESDGVRWAERGDSRITRSGRWLRLTRLDECPQFWNVLRGEMSIVGPRPERAPFVTLLSREVPGYLERLRFKPGITGLAQVQQGYDQSLDSVYRKVYLDLQYIARFSLWMDVKILLRSVKVVVTGQGAF